MRIYALRGAEIGGQFPRSMASRVKARRQEGLTTRRRVIIPIIVYNDNVGRQSEIVTNTDLLFCKQSSCNTM